MVSVRLDYTRQCTTQQLRAAGWSRMISGSVTERSGSGQATDAAARTAKTTGKW